tara:strand:+ start:685 stop:1587 length:903 start_codon:yes stop_codon:yes gene_type:complete
MPVSDTPHICWTEKEFLQKLQGPVIVVAFEGWNDAGEAASTAARYVRDHFQSTEVGAIEAEEFFDFTISRPLVQIKNGERDLVWPATSIHAAELPGSKYDLITLLGYEPQLKWQTFTNHVIAVAKLVEAPMVVTLGALLTDIPHSRPVRVYGSTDSPELKETFDLSPPSYEGPTGIVGVLSSALRESDIPNATFWAGVPAYVSGASSPKAALALVEKLCHVLNINVPCTDLEIASASYERQVNDLVAEDENTTEYVQQLETNFDNGELDDDENSHLVREDPGHLIAEVEDFLRNQPGQAQ